MQQISSVSLGQGRSESVRTFSRQGPSISALAEEAHASHHRQLPLHLDDNVRVFSCSANIWVHGKVVDLQDFPLVCVEYWVPQHWCRKTLHLNSEHLVWATRLQGASQNQEPSAASLHSGTTSEEEVDPGNTVGFMPSAQIHDLAWYQKMESIWEVLDQADVVLIKGRWLIQQYWDRKVLPCRQELPPEAIWSVQELRSKFGAWHAPLSGKLKLVAISHCWLTPEHPDPDGSQLQEVGPFLEALEGTRPFYAQFDDEDTIAVFWAWCSLYQRRRHTPNGHLERTPVEERLFAHALSFMHIWYAHECVHTWCVTQVPEGAPYGYHELGWTTWELAVSLLITGAGVGGSGAQVLDLSLFDEARVRKSRLGLPRYDDIVSTCQAIRQVPLTPDAFNSVIEMKVFGSRNADLPIVKQNYRDAFSAIVASTPFLSYVNLGWRDEHAEVLARMLPLCSELHDLDLSDNLIHDVGLHVLGAALKECPNLLVLKVNSNPCSFSVASGLALELDSLVYWGGPWLTVALSSEFSPF